MSGSRANLSSTKSQPTARYAISRLCSASRSTSSTCSRDTPGNHSRNSSIRAPLSRFSKSAFTDTRVPLNSHAPLTFPGVRSTAGHWLQSSMADSTARVRATLRIQLRARNNLRYKESGPSEAELSIKWVLAYDSPRIYAHEHCRATCAHGHATVGHHMAPPASPDDWRPGHTRARCGVHKDMQLG